MAGKKETEAFENEYEAAVRELAIKHWAAMVGALDELCEHEVPPKDHKDYLKTSTFKANAIRAQFAVCQGLAKGIAGVVKASTGRNTKEQKDLAAELVENTRKRMKEKGIE